MECLGIKIFLGLKHTKMLLQKCKNGAGELACWSLDGFIRWVLVHFWKKKKKKRFIVNLNFAIGCGSYFTSLFFRNPKNETALLPGNWLWERLNAAQWFLHTADVRVSTRHCTNRGNSSRYHWKNCLSQVFNWTLNNPLLQWLIW